MMLNKSAIRKFVKERNPKIRRISKSYFEALNVKVERMVVASAIQNLSRKTLTHNELTGVNGIGITSTKCRAGEAWIRDILSGKAST